MGRGRLLVLWSIGSGLAPHPRGLASLRWLALRLAIILLFFTCYLDIFLSALACSVVQLLLSQYPLYLYQDLYLLSKIQKFKRVSQIPIQLT